MLAQIDGYRVGSYRVELSRLEKIMEKILMSWNRNLVMMATLPLLLAGTGLSLFMPLATAQTGPRVAQTERPSRGEHNQREGGRWGQGGPRLNLAAAAEQLGTTEAELRSALGLPAPGEQPDREAMMARRQAMRQQAAARLSAAAAELGVEEADLVAAMRSQWQQRSQNGRGLTAMAEELGVSEDALRSALMPENGWPEGARVGGRRPGLDIAAAAEALGVTEAEVIDALGLSQRRPNQAE
jgi:hypothetical protein